MKARQHPAPIMSPQTKMYATNRQSQICLRSVMGVSTRASVSREPIETPAVRLAVPAAFAATLRIALTVPACPREPAMPTRAQAVVPPTTSALREPKRSHVEPAPRHVKPVLTVLPASINDAQRAVDLRIAAAAAMLQDNVSLQPAIPPAVRVAQHVRIARQTARRAPATDVWPQPAPPPAPDAAWATPVF